MRAVHPDVTMTLRELRAYTGKTQAAAAASNAMTQSELSRLERRDDFLLSTLRDYVDALGGGLEVHVLLGSSRIRLTDGEARERAWSIESAREAVQELSSLAQWLPPLVRGLSAARLRARLPGHGEFSLVEHVCHLRDIDADGYFPRVRRTLRETRPTLPDVDGGALAEERHYATQPLAPALRALLAGRKKVLPGVLRLDATKLAREAVLDGVGPVPLAELVHRWRTHDLGHRVEMEKLSRALRAGGTA
jgi:Helix-turn-helix domain